MADAMGNSFLIIVLPLYVASDTVTGDAFGIPTSLVAGIVLALFGIASSIAQPWAGHISDRSGRRKPFVLGGLAVFGAVNLAFVGVTHYWELFVLRVVQGVAAAFTITASLALVNEGSTAERRGQHMGVYNSFRLVGFGAGPLLASILIEMGPYEILGMGTVSGFDATFAVASATAILSLVLVVGMVEDLIGHTQTSRRLSIQVWKQDGRGLDTIFSLGLATLVMAACLALLSAIEPEVNQRLGQGPILFAVEFVSLIAVLAVLQPFVGRASDEWGRKPFIVVGLILLVASATALLYVLVMRFAAGRRFQVDLMIAFGPFLAFAIGLIFILEAAGLTGLAGF